MPRNERIFQYQEIAQELRRQILRGDFHPHERLPSERNLCEQFQVQRNTVRQALSILEAEGRIITHGKRGSFVCPVEPLEQGRDLVLYTPLGNTPMANQLLGAFSTSAEAAGFNVVRTDVQPLHGRGLSPLPDLSALPNSTAGIALWPQNPTDAEAINRIGAAVPLVLIDRRVPGVSCDCVRFDDVEGGRLVTEHLLQQGHRRIGFISDDPFAETVQFRWRGYALAHELAGVPIVPWFSLFFNGIDRSYFATGLRHILGLDEAPTAFVCSNDLVAFVLLRFLQDEGLRVPSDVAVTGYGNIMPEYTEALALTSVNQPFDALGEAAANILIERYRKGLPKPGDTLDFTIPVQLVPRSSSLRRHHGPMATSS